MFCYCYYYYYCCARAVFRYCCAPVPVLRSKKTNEPVPVLRGKKTNNDASQRELPCTGLPGASA